MGIFDYYLVAAPLSFGPIGRLVWAPIKENLGNAQAVFARAVFAEVARELRK